MLRGNDLRLVRDESKAASGLWKITRCTHTTFGLNFIIEKRMDPDFNARVYLVTGGASGLGEAAVRRLHALGASVSILDRSDTRAKVRMAGTASTIDMCKGSRHVRPRAYRKTKSYRLQVAARYGSGLLRFWG